MAWADQFTPLNLTGMALVIGGIGLLLGALYKGIDVNSVFNMAITLISLGASLLSGQQIITMYKANALTQQTMNNAMGEAISAIARAKEPTPTHTHTIETPITTPTTSGSPQTATEWKDK